MLDSNQRHRPPKGKLVAVRDLLFFVLEPVRLPSSQWRSFSAAYSGLFRLTLHQDCSVLPTRLLCRVSAVDCALFLLNDFTRRPFGFYSKVRRGLVAVDVSKIYQDPY